MKGITHDEFIYICFSQREVRKKYLLKVCTIENLDKMATKNVRVT